MADINRNLTLSIKALVEGLKDVANLGDQFLKVAEAGKKMEEQVSPALNNVGNKAKTTKTELENAFNALGGRSTDSIKKELEAVSAALEQVRKSGASLEEVARAEALAENATRRLNNELKNPAPVDFKDRLQKIVDLAKEGNFKGMLGELASLKDSMGVIGSLLGPITGGFIALTGLKSFASLIQDATQLAARVETLNVTLQAVGRNAGYSQQTIETQINKVKALGITSEAAADSLTKMIQAGIRIDETTSSGLTKAQELARAAQDLAVVTGENSSQTLQRLIVNIQQMDTVGLRFMGLTVNATSAQQQFANSIGKTVSALTEHEKKQAFLNATMVEARKLQGVYEDSMETLGKKLSSLTRYQDEFKVALGSTFLGAGVSLADGARDFLDTATKILKAFNDTSTASRDLKEGMQPLVSLIGDVLVVVVRVALDIFGGLAMVFKQVGGAVGDVTKLVKGAIDAFLGLFDTSGGVGDFLEKLDPIKGFFTGVSLLIAGLRDGFTVLMYAGGQLTGALVDGFATLLSGLSKVVGFFNKDLGAALEASATNFKTYADNIRKNTDSQMQALMDGKGAVAQFADSYETAGKKISANAARVSEVSKAIDELSKKQQEGKLTTVEVQKEYDRLTDAMGRMKDQGGLTKEEFVKLSKQLDAVPGSLVANFNEAATAAGVSLAALRTQVTESVSKTANVMGEFINGAITKNEDILKRMGSSLATMGNDMMNVFRSGMKESKTLDDIATLITRVKEAADKGVISQQDLKQAVTEGAVKFEEMFQAQLKAAKTKDDFDKLAKGVGDVAAQGGITKERMIIALNAISDATDATKSKMQQLAEASQKVSLSDASLKVAQAQLAITQASVDVASKRVAVWVAENAQARNNNELTNLGVQVARLDLQVATENLALARLRYKEEVENMNLLITKQRELNSEVALKGHEDDARLQVAAQAARDAARAQELITDKVKEQVNAQQEAVLKVQEQQLQTKSQYDILKTVTEENQKNTQVINNNTTATNSHTQATNSLRDSANGAAGAFQGVATAVGTIGDAMNQVGVASSNWSSGVIAEYQRVSNSISQLISQQQQLDMNGGNGADVLSSGSGIVGPIDPSKSWQAETDKRNAEVTKSAADDKSKRDKQNSQAVDNSGWFLIQDKLANGTLSQNDKAMVEGAWKAAQANLQQVQSDPSGLVGNYVSIPDAMKWYNLTRTAMEQLNAGQLAGQGDTSRAGFGMAPRIAARPVAGKTLAQARATQLAYAMADNAPGNIMPTTPGGSGVDTASPVITKKISVDLTVGGKTVNAQVDPNDETSLLALLNSLKNRS